MCLYRVMRPLLFCLPPEVAHKAAITYFKAFGGFHKPQKAYPELQVNLWGKTFPNPVGLAAGFDKEAEVLHGALNAGFGFVEAGTVTPQPQPGNPQPRVFRLPQDQAVINRMGFPGNGLEPFYANLKRFRASGHPGLVGVNIGKNKATVDDVADYVACAERLVGLADYWVINVSSPNTPGLRALQGEERLRTLVEAVRTVPGVTDAPLLVKLAPDLTEQQIEDTAALALDLKLDGLVVSNTTVARPDSLQSRHKGETGGLSGKPLFEPSTVMLKTLYRLTKGQVPLIGVGGVASAAQAWEKILAGASLVQIYTGLVYEGPDLVQYIHDGLAANLIREGYTSIQDAVGKAAV